MLVDFARLPESFSDLDSLEKWLEGYDNDKFDPENALVNVLYAQNETEGQLTNDSLDRPKTMNLVVKPKNLEKIEIGFIALGVKEERGKLKRMYDIINVRLNLGSTKDYKSTIEDAVKKNKKAGFTYAADLHKSIHITSEDNAVNGEYRISITNDATSLGKDLTKNIYAVKIGVVAEDFEPFQSSLYRLSYKYRDNIYAKSSSDSYILKSAGRNKTVETTRLPIFMEKRYEPIKFNFDFSYESLSSCTANTFKPLIEELQKKFEEKLAALSLLSRRKATRDDLHSERIKREFDNDAKRLKLELNATASGVTLLAADSDLLKAFRMLNSAFAERYKSEHKRDSNYKNSEWRSFQLTFLLAQLSSVFNNEKTLVLLNFPTGMGKTEAFVGLSILKIIYERLTKTNHGTSVVIKYPRKLLSRQQLKRALSLVTFANAVLFNGANQVYQHPISLGALFNSEDSPNRYIDAGSGYRYTTKEFQDWKRDPDGEKRAIILEKCPYCNEDITVVVDDQLLRIKFLCKNNDCFFYKNEAGKFLERGPGELPLYIGDDEVFRYLPSILITTIDKFSSFASNNPNFKTLFLESRTVLDSRYGFYFTDKHFKYFQKSRSGNETTWDFFHEYFKAPTLFVFDEIHLINGAYASKLSVIENAFMTLFSKIPGGKEPHILCSSATVCQIFNDDGLFAYQSDMARMFIVPPDKVTLYPVFWDIFVKQEPDYRRLITAVMPCNFSHYLAIEHVSGYYFNKFREIPVEYKKYYSTFLYYFKAKARLERVRGSLWERVIAPKPEFNGDNFSDMEFSTDKLQSEMEKEQANIEHIISLPAKNIEKINMVFATNTIANGLDIDAFNVMFIFGFPNKISEYIQARSRISRKNNAGLCVFFLSQKNFREISVLYDFYNLHENINLAVEATTINREGEGVIDSMIKKLFHLALQWKYDSRSAPFYTRNTLLKVIDSRDQLDSLKEMAYGWFSFENVSRDTARRIFDEKWSGYISRYKTWLESTKDSTIYSDTNPCLPQPSLLDISTPILVRLSDESSAIATDIGHVGTPLYAEEPNELGDDEYTDIDIVQKTETR